ncbi:hypothetical protein AAHC03_016640 [Spirometra sp. Aus1]
MSNTRTALTTITASPRGPDISSAVSTCLDNFTENNDALGKMLEKLGNGANISDRTKKIAHDLVLELYTKLATRCQLGLYSGNLLYHLVEQVNQFEMTCARVKSNHRKLLRVHREDEAARNFMIDRIAELQNILAATREASLYWKFMYELNQFEYNLAEALDERKIWRSSKAYDTQWIAEIAGPLQTALQPIYAAIVPSLIEDGMKMAINLPKPEDHGMATYATALERIAQRCYEEGFYTEAETLMNAAQVIRKDVYGPNNPIIACGLTCLALIYGKMKNFEKAIKTNAESMAIWEKCQLDDGLVAKNYLQAGNMLLSWGKEDDGVRALKLALSRASDGLPLTGDIWDKCAVRLARACNEAEKPDDAINLGCKIIEAFHEKTFGIPNDNSPVIYDVALAMQKVVTKAEGKKSQEDAAAMTQALAKLNAKLPPAVALPTTVQDALKEVAVAHATCYRFKAATVLKDYLEECKPVRLLETSSSAPRRMTVIGRKSVYR